MTLESAPAAESDCSDVVTCIRTQGRWVCGNPAEDGRFSSLSKTDFTEAGIKNVFSLVASLQVLKNRKQIGPKILMIIKHTKKLNLTPFVSRNTEMRMTEEEKYNFCFRFPPLLVFPPSPPPPPPWLVVAKI